MPRRKDAVNSTKIRSQGILDGARVVRGPDWDWGNQDGNIVENSGNVIENSCVKY